jgi:hypothetical protein
MDDIPPEMIAAVTELAPTLLSLQDVNGVDIGLDDAGEFTIRVLVVDPSNPPADLPDDINGFSYVLVAGQPMQEPGTIPDAAKYDPVIGGVQIAPAAIVGGNVHAGTLGCVFRNADGQSVGVSNAHVLCGGVGDVVQQPAPSTDPAPALEQLGTVAACLAPDLPSIVKGGLVSGTWDASLCLIDNGRAATVGEIVDLGAVAGISSPKLGDRVRKRGHRSGVTYGIVEGLFGAYVASDSGGNALWWMVGQVCIALIPDVSLNPLGVWSRGGDSGSVVVNDNNEIVALHWGGDANSRGYASDFSTLAVALGISL